MPEEPIFSMLCEPEATVKYSFQVHISPRLKFELADDLHLCVLIGLRLRV